MDKYNNIVFSSRIRLARNLENIAFTNRMNKQDADRTLNSVFHALEEIGSFNCYKTSSLSEATLVEYVEDHIISKECISNGNISGLAVSKDNIVSIMVNEEDHLREQCILNGLNLRKVYDILTDIDKELSARLKFAYDAKLGYLTACPSNVGTGMRASVMLFLPALAMTNSIEEIVNTVSKMGICVRGAYGEGSGAVGYMYQVSNQITLGKSEKEIISLVESTVIKICELELDARREILRTSHTELADDVLRAFGILSNCYKINAAEAMELLSKVKLGVGLQIIKLNNSEIIDDLLQNISAIKILKLSHKILNDEQRDIYRAEYLGRVLKNTKL